MKIQWDYMRPTMLGWSCPDCGVCMLFIEGAFHHEIAIEENGGTCPKAVKKDEDESA